MASAGPDALALRERWRRAARLDASPWLAGIALAAGAGVAWAVVHGLPASGADVAAARALGIVSVTTLAGHSKSAESLAYALGLSSAIAASVALWAGWASFAGRCAPTRGEAPPFRARRVGALELAVAAALAVPFARPWLAQAAWVSPWFLLAEEGESLAWIDTLLRGGALSRDVFCLYGPLSTWPIALLFAASGLRSCSGAAGSSPRACPHCSPSGGC